jgi:hypothetical protein
MKKNIFILSILVSVFACKSKSDESSKDSTKSTDTVATAINNQEETEAPMCFLFAENKDSTFVRLYFDGENVTGNMRWMPNEKDGAIGTLQGKIKDNIITADYNYVIEGSEQVEEKIFVLKDNDNILEEKSGELEDKNGKLIIKDPAKATVQTTLKKVDCKVVDSAF